MTLDGVNEEQEIVAPTGAKPLSALFLKLDINPLELAGSLQRGEGLESILKQFEKKVLPGPSAAATRRQRRAVKAAPNGRCPMPNA